jgi:Protein of unknown function (DUF2889)
MAYGDAACHLKRSNYVWENTVASTQIAFSIPIPQSTYERRFEAEIDALTDNELLVRGRMHDHRFTFEHVWRLRTPEFEVLEASAAQHAGDPSQFKPELCGRYANIKGVRLERGFSKGILTELGDFSGAQEHLFLAIEMARVGQQVYQVPLGFEAQLERDDSVGASLTAYNFWKTDRAYMPKLANSCHTYRDASAVLFAEREVRTGFTADLYSPKAGDKRVFWREKGLSVAIRRDSAGNVFYACQSSMNDTVHDITVKFDLASDGVISNARSSGLRLPYHGICEDAQLRTARLNGMRANDDSSIQFADRIGGSEGCAHLLDLSTDLWRLFKTACRT